MFEDAKERLKWVDQQIHLLEKRLSQAPEGSLQICTTRGIPRYYQVFSCAQKKVYLGKDHDDLIGCLAQKGYDQKALAILRQEREFVAEFLESDDPTLLESLYASMQEARKRYVRPLVLPDDEYAQEWEHLPYSQKPIDEARALSTDRGDLVRSKSEVMIANALLAAGVPYRYEPSVELPGIRTVHPDFMVLNKRTRREYLWEHLGMMDDPQYATRAMRKLADYDVSGYVEGRDLIVTMEGMGCQLDMRRIWSRIEAFLL